MKKRWILVCMLMTAAALLACPSSSEAQKGKGWGKGGKIGPAPGQVKPFDADKGEPARPFAQPKSGNDLPPATLDKLPPGLDAKPNSLPQEIRDKLPPGLRNQPDNNPGLANHLRQLGVLKDYPQIDPVPSQVRSQMPAWMQKQPYDNPAVANYLGKLGYSYGQDGALIPPPTTPPPASGLNLLQNSIVPASTAPSAPGLNLFQNFQPLGGLFRPR